MVLGSTTRNLPVVKGRPARKADNLTAICEPIIWIMWESRRPTILWVSTACYRDRFTFTFSLSDTTSYFNIWDHLYKLSSRYFSKLNEECHVKRSYK
jgi:hypothetical protein